MNKVALKLGLTVLLVLIVGQSAFSQLKIDDKTRPGFQISGFPIVYGQKEDGYPEKIRIKGKIVDASPAGFYCGTFAVAGTLKIKLDETVKDFNGDHVYILILCFAVEKKEKLMGKTVEWDVQKLENYPYSFDVLVTNTVDSKGVPFYMAEFEGVGGLSDKLVKGKKN